MNADEERFVDKEIAALLHNRSIVEVPEIDIPKGAWFSPIFVVPKPEPGEYRLILNVSELNKEIEYKKFKLINITEILDLIPPKSYLAKIDWTLAFNHLPIFEGHQKFLMFQWRQKSFKFLCHPNGISVAPYNINRLCRNLVKYLQCLWVNLCLYIDDSIIIQTDKKHNEKEHRAHTSDLQTVWFHRK